jgi:hypothetical protein
MKINELLINIYRSDGFFNHAQITNKHLDTRMFAPERAEQLCTGEIIRYGHQYVSTQNAYIRIIIILR